VPQALAKEVELQGGYVIRVPFVGGSVIAVYTASKLPAPGPARPGFARTVLASSTDESVELQTKRHD
jgi:hypothetical protein